MKNRGIEYYMSLQYRINLRPLSEDDGGGWLAEAIELPGCMSDGETPEDAIRNLEGAKEVWIETALEKGLVVPEPKIESEPEYNGRVTLRLPSSLHKKTTEMAKREGMSYNSYLLYLLSENHSAVLASKALSVCQKLIEKNSSTYNSANEKLWDVKMVAEYEEIVGTGGVKFATRRQ